MTEEEKEVIEQLKSWREFIINNKNKVNRANDIEFYLRTALNLIQKQQETTEKKNKIINEMAKAMINYDCFIKECNHYAGENKKLCEDCIIQYFESKVEHENT